MYIFLDLAERIEVIRKKIKDMEANEGITTPSNLPAPGTNKELNNNNPAPIAAPSGARTGRAAPSSSSGQVGFGPGGLNATLVSDRRESKRDNHTTDEDEIVSPLEISEVLTLSADDMCWRDKRGYYGCSCTMKRRRNRCESS